MGSKSPMRRGSFGKKVTHCQIYRLSAVSWFEFGTVVDSDGPKEAQVQLYLPGGTSVSNDTAVSCAKTAGPIDLPFVLGTWVGRRKHKFNRIHRGTKVPTWEGTLVPPGKYYWTIRLWRQCSLMSDYFDDFFSVLWKCPLVIVMNDDEYSSV